MINECIGCDSAFESERKAKYCSDTCRQRVHRKAKRADRVETKKQCLECGAEFVTSRNQKYCDERCAALWRKSHTERKKRVRTSECMACGVAFSHASAGGKLYCSSECRRSVRRKKVKQLRCRTCGERFFSWEGASRAYCSEACKPKRDDKCKHCGREIGEESDGRYKVYCSLTCKLDAVAERKKERQKETLQKNRDRAAVALRMLRGGAAMVDAEIAVAASEGGGPSFLARMSRMYRRQTKRKKDAAKWCEEERRRNAKSKHFHLESEFREHMATVLCESFDIVKQEASVGGTRRKIDIVVEHGLFCFGIELKNSNRTARLDQSLGQSIVKCTELGIAPCCAVPDDLSVDDVFLKGCNASGVMAGRMSDVVHMMREKCGISAKPDKKGTSREI